MGNQRFHMKISCVWLAAGLLLGGAAHAQAEADWRYRVQPGDTLLSLTGAWMAPPRTWRDLQQLNRVADPLRLRPGSTLRMPVAWLKREAGVAEAVFVRGDVSRERGATREPLAAGATLQSGDRLRTGEQSSASLRFADGSRLLIPPGSDIALEQLLVLGRGALPAVQLRIAKGGADSRVAPNAQRLPLYDVRTPHVNLGVRGTEFRVQADGATTHMQVLSGAVHADGLRADVAAGQGLLAEGAARDVSPLLPAPDLGGLEPRVERLPLRLAWAGGPAGAVTWRAQLYARGDFAHLLLDAHVAEPVAAWPEARDLPDGDYTLRVRAIDARGHEGAAADADIRLAARPEPPFIQSPPPSATVYGERAVALAWTRNTAAPRVRLQVARDAGFADKVLDTPPLDGNGRQLDLPFGVYHWRIASVAADGRSGPFGDPQTFELKPPPPAPPPAASEVEGDQLKLRWRADPGVAHYELEWAGDDAFAGDGVQRFQAAQPELVLPKPPPGRYFLRARAVNAAGAAGPWGQTQAIEQPAPPVRWPWLLPLLLLPLL
ncbi:MAG: FecR domain-containing protein [Roseateles sp.]|uniref:FecR domain-containing protein n=1 Tax=Roseateles sp. TaxID=1971397 RepID=UPI0039E9FA81